MSFRPAVAFLVGFITVAGCQCLQPVREVPCGKWNCAGCCDSTGSCLPGTALNACGAEASACSTCIANQACNTGVCRDTSCSGCIVPGDGGCVTGESNQACGSGGITCEACSEGGGKCSLKRCVYPDGGTGGGAGGGTGGGTGGGAGGGAGGGTGGGAGGGGGTGLCGPMTCPGCCQNGTCFNPADAQHCGRQGQACQTCTTNQTCNNNGRCVQRPPDGGVCGPNSGCIGCCFNNTCFPGDQPFACGGSGSQCALCPNGTVCTGGACVRPADAGAPVGAPCQQSSQCAASSFAFCLPENTGWPAGYCSQVCVSMGPDGGCPGGSLCVPSSFSSSALICLANCTPDGGQGNCRQNYVCQPRPPGPAGQTVATCQPRCNGTTNACPTPMVCGDAGICK
jgi:hypothetical protein